VATSTPLFPALRNLNGLATVVALAAGHGRLRLIVALKFLEVQAIERGLGVKRVDVGRAAFHHEETTRNTSIKELFLTPPCSNRCRYSQRFRLLRCLRKLRATISTFIS